MSHPSQHTEINSEPDSKGAKLDFKRVVSLAYPERVPLIWGTLALLIGTSIGLAVPVLVGHLLDGVTKGSGRSVLNQSIILLMILFVISGFATALRSYLFTVAGEKIVARLRSQLYESIIQREIAFFDQRRTGELLNRLASDTTVLQNAVTVNLSMALRFGLQTLGAIAILIWTSWQLTLVMLAVVPMVAIGTGIYGRSLRKVSTEVQDALGRASEVAEETLSAVRTVRAFASESQEIERYSKAVDESFELAKYRSRLVAIFMGGMSFAGYGAIAAVLWYGGILLIDGAMSFGVLTSFILYTFTIAVGLTSLSGLWADFAKASGASERVFELIDSGSESQVGLLKPTEISGKVTLDDIHFTYPTRLDTPVLKGLSMTLEPGKVIALVGPSGGGKSTVAALLSRLYEPDKGHLSLDDTLYKELDAHWIRQQVGVVSQEPILFATSIANNIRYANAHASDEQIEIAAQAANAHTFVSEFPEGYQTLVGERGVRLSGGQKQRIAIARALLKDPSILVLDEATSALDGESEHLVQEALERLMEGRSTLVIAHRLSTVKQANQVLVLDGGRVIESGTHDELIELNGLYKRLVDHQFKE